MGQPLAKYSEQGNSGKFKKLAVRRPVYIAARELLRKTEARSSRELSRAATDKVNAAFAEGSLAEARFWSEVHLFIVSRNFLDGQLMIIEEPGRKNGTGR